MTETKSAQKIVPNRSYSRLKLRDLLVLAHLFKTEVGLHLLTALPEVTLIR